MEIYVGDRNGASTSLPNEVGIAAGSVDRIRLEGGKEKGNFLVSV